MDTKGFGLGRGKWLFFGIRFGIDEVMLFALILLLSYL